MSGRPLRMRMQQGALCRPKNAPHKAFDMTAAPLARPALPEVWRQPCWPQDQQGIRHLGGASHIDGAHG